jgi:FKBP-type peptidyl-prolyl cis-trans isomerase (trigger factor)
LISCRNDALAAALIEKTQFQHLPESLIDESTQGRFQNMLMDFKEQGSTEEQLQEMASEASYNKYKEISRKNTEKIVKLGLLFRDIAEKESIIVPEEEIRAQLDLLNAQAKQKGESMPDEMQAREEIENTLLRLKVFDFLASHATIEYVDEVKPKE